MTQRIRRAWQYLVGAASALTVPETDVAASDRAVETALRDSRLFRAVDAAGGSARRAWPHARTRACLLRLAADRAAWSGPARVRAAGAGVAAAGLTAVLAEIMTPLPAEPVAWVLPAAVAGLGLLASIAAAPLAHAIDDKRS